MSIKRLVPSSIKLKKSPDRVDYIRRSKSNISYEKNVDQSDYYNLIWLKSSNNVNHILKITKIVSKQNKIHNI